LPPLRVRIGLHSGWVLAGSLGSVDRWEYGLIGDALICVARFEALEKGRRPFPCRVLLSGATRALVGEVVPARWSAWGQVPLAGRAGSEEIWEWLEPVGAGPP
jgi:adenylate cyclase